MGKSKGTRSTYIPFALGPYLYPTISVAVIVITNRKTSYRDNSPVYTYVHMHIQVCTYVHM